MRVLATLATISILILIFGALGGDAASKYKLKFHPRFKIPDNTDIDNDYFSLPLKTFIPNPIVVWLVNATTDELITEGRDANMKKKTFDGYGYLKIQVLSKKWKEAVEAGGVGNDTWNGQLCSWNRMDDEINPMHRFRPAWRDQWLGFPCTKAKWNHTMKGYGYHFEHPYYEQRIGMYKGETYLRRLVIFGEDFGDDSRFLRFSYQAINETETIYLDSAYFNVTDSDEYLPDRLVLDGSLPSTVTANNPFHIPLKAVNTNGSTVTGGVLSKLELMASVGYIHKWWKIGQNTLHRILSTEAQLGGTNWIKSPDTHDQVIYETMSAGQANISCQIEDVHSQLELNVTMVRNFAEYQRFPWKDDCYRNGVWNTAPPMTGPYHYDSIYGQCILDSINGVDTLVRNSSHVRYWHSGYYAPDHYRSIVLANVTVVAQTPATFRIVPGHVMTTNQTSNLPIIAPLQVELLDDKGYRVTSGPDASLAVTATLVGTGTLSSDSSFNLERGIGTFKGSVVGSASGVRLTFSTTLASNPSTTLNTANSDAFDVFTELYIASIFDSTNEKSFKSIALNDINVGKYTLMAGVTITQKSATDGVDLMNLIGNGMDQTPQERYIGVTSSGSSSEVIVAQAIASGFSLPMVHSTQDQQFKTTSVPLVSRVTFDTPIISSMMATLMHKRRWTRAVVLVNEGESAPKSLSDYFYNMGIVKTEAMFPFVPDTSTAVPATVIDGFFDKITSFKTRVIVSFLHGAPLNYVLAEAVKKNVSPADGYIWVGNQYFQDDFPYSNEGHCATQNCAYKFNGATIFSPHYEHTSSMGSTLWTTTIASYGSTPATTESSKLGAAYDSVIALCEGIAKIVTASNTIHPEDLDAKIKEVTFGGLSGQIGFTSSGARTKYSATMHQIQAATSSTTGKANLLKLVKYLYYADDVVAETVDTNTTVSEYMVTGASLVYPTMPIKNNISIPTIDGTISTDLVKTSSNAVTAIEEIPPAKYCSLGCGGSLLSASDHDIWAHGTCDSMETCVCNTDLSTGRAGYSGATCANPVCDACYFGTCTGPSQCTCQAGYIDSSPSVNDCGQASCSLYGCSAHGTCTSPNNCACQPNYYGTDCSQKCDCANGKCSDGNTGSGKCDCDSGYMGDKCDLKVAVVAVPVTIGCIIAICLLVFFGYKHYQKINLMAQLMSMDWKASWEEIRMRQKRDKSSMKSMMSMMSMMSAKSTKEDKVVCQNQGNWNGKEIVIKQLRKDDVQITDAIRWEIKQMKDIKHPNLCAFIGAVIESPHVAVLNEVCGKGSLEDILYNDDMELGWDFRYSMMKDICRGMKYLHKSEVGSHGRLKTSNCLVDNKWTVKISDFGMKEFKKNQYGVRIFNPGKNLGIELPSDEQLEECDYFNLLWTAPEIIATGVSHPNHVEYGTQKGDIYSFGIILTEMCSRTHPFTDLDYLGPEEIVQMVGHKTDLAPGMDAAYIQEFKVTDEHGGSTMVTTIRPCLAEDDLPNDAKQTSGLIDIIGRCWHEDPALRPDFGECEQAFNKIVPTRGELMDNLVELMEQYTFSLESIVAERTADLATEKAASDALLSKMLPPLIAEELKLGGNPQPEYFNCVTIYFSDVIGFGRICAESTPFDIVELLNDLYSIMDDVIDGFDCYKVETIADSYVVASGLPQRNGDRHASEIANMALHLLAAINNVGYKHLPGSQVQLRIGMNSGPIVGGVVGLRMPRYCLFGDTMNTAARMESGGYALKIHISEDTYKLLESSDGTFICESRGERNVKGRGIMTTYWLKGKQGFELELPSEDKAASLSEHEFK